MPMLSHSSSLCCSSRSWGPFDSSCRGAGQLPKGRSCEARCPTTIDDLQCICVAPVPCCSRTRCSFLPSNVHVPWIAGKEAQALCAVRDGRVMHRGHESSESIDRHTMRDPRLLPSNVLRIGCVVLPGTAAPAKARALVIKSQETCNMKGEAP